MLGEGSVNVDLLPNGSELVNEISLSVCVGMVVEVGYPGCQYCKCSQVCGAVLFVCVVRGSGEEFFGVSKGIFARCG